jgi:hypothetical protein
MNLPSPRSRQALLAIAVLLITAYGGLLRLDAFVGKYGTLDHPAWARVMTHDVAPLARYVRPASVAWGREDRPYIGGDPITYLEFARDMKSFYQPHVREPVYLTTTRFALWTVDDQDAGISLASAAGSIFAIFATYLLGAAVVSRAGGLAAAFILAIEYQAITWSVDGWRDDTFMAMVVLAAWALVRLRAKPSMTRAVVAGLAGAAACLTRITAITFLLPALVWIVLDGPWHAVRWRARHASVALLVLVALVAPYLISCALATGDPLLAVNYHTTYYRYAEGLPIGEPMSAAEYVGTKFARHPIATIDTGVTGLFVQPFITKWHGLQAWSNSLGTVLSIAAIAGMAAWLFTGTGRLLLVVIVSSLLPYAFTWNVGGGAEWRFTMHVYSFYIVAAMFALFGTWRVLKAVVRDRSVWTRQTVLPIVARVAAVVAIAALAVALYIGLPWFVVREGIANGESTSIEVGSRDLVFYREGWTAPRGGGNVIMRVEKGPRATIWLPLPAKRAYDLVLRMDPVAPGMDQRVTLLLNGRLVGRLTLTFDAQRVGSYRIPLPEWVVQPGRNELTLVPEVRVMASEAGPRYAWIDPAEQIGVSVWYVRVLP